MQKIKTLIFHPALAPYRVDLFNEIAKFLDLKIFFLRENLLNQNFDQTTLRKQLHCQYDFLLSGFDFKGRSFRWGITRAIKEYCPDVVVCMEYSPVTLWISALKYLHVAGHWGMVVWTDDNVAMCNGCKTIRKIARNLILRVADSLLVCSEPVKKCYAQFKYVPTNISVCRVIHNEAIFHCNLVESLSFASIKLSDSLLSGKKIVLFVGRLVSIKGVDRLLKAFVGVSAALQNVILMIVGDGPEKENLISLASTLGIYDKVVFTGRLEGPELYACYLLGDLFVLSSHYERYGAVVNEALLAGMPVIVSSTAGASELIIEGFNGHIFDPFDIDRLTNLMIEELQKVQPRTKKCEIRQSLMPIRFEENVHEFIQAVRCARYKRKNVKY